jgi:hypothetical protein
MPSTLACLGSTLPRLLVIERKPYVYTPVLRWLIVRSEKQRQGILEIGMLLPQLSKRASLTVDLAQNAVRLLCSDVSTVGKSCSCP